MLLNINQSFHCTNCGNEFKGLGIEWRGTAFIQPLKCPKCGSWHTRPSSIFGCISNRFYRPIWKGLDEWSKKR
jgi:DNA-directed RNA polymerase subunit RPC12/RpoP